ncbi:MAG: 16S rRNA (adenine(1518)-N(6)/adenine(1519)-N(6))-dimethyltransferase RsmA [Puniceicoccales bacterium]|jgi:16S rRNA (adenine1518-N6/adenine1519-N6)-dimethyltransferase|nr:16S rRNA (adenine(1518)-N(6)/adenine(1519)-N(6))-dimethyltransferase RsmA [Puniceicoccales bacterium]
MEPILEPLSLKQTRLLLESLGIRPSKQLGQNFLIDKNIVWKSIRLAQLCPGERVVEIGSGLGTLTRALLAQQCCVFAIEFDQKLYQFLSKIFTEMPNFHITQGDAVAHPLAGLSDFTHPFKIVANLPYNIATPWIDALLEQNYIPTSMTLMLQKEAAERLLAQPNSKQFSAISIFLSAMYTCKVIFPVARSSFFPGPKVNSTIIYLEQLVDSQRFTPVAKKLIRNIFTQRRKQMGSLLKVFASEWYKSICELLEQHHCIPSIRPEQLSIRFWLDPNTLLAT